MIPAALNSTIAANFNALAMGMNSISTPAACLETASELAGYNGQDASSSALSLEINEGQLRLWNTPSQLTLKITLRGQRPAADFSFPEERAQVTQNLASSAITQEGHDAAIEGITEREAFLQLANGGSSTLPVSLEYDLVLTRYADKIYRGALVTVHDEPAVSLAEATVAALAATGLSSSAITIPAIFAAFLGPELVFQFLGQGTPQLLRELQAAADVVQETLGLEHPLQLP